MSRFHDFQFNSSPTHQIHTLLLLHRDGDINAKFLFSHKNWVWSKIERGMEQKRQRMRTRVSMRWRILTIGCVLWVLAVLWIAGTRMETKEIHEYHIARVCASTNVMIGSRNKMMTATKTRGLKVVNINKAWTRKNLAFYFGGNGKS